MKSCHIKNGLDRYLGFLKIAGLMVSRDSGTDMKGKVVRRIFSLGCAAIFVLLLTGCDPTAGATNYEVIYPSGYSRDCYKPITTICIFWMKMVRYCIVIPR